MRLSYCLEDVATEFDVQGLELDWTCLAWDADLRLTEGSWSFKNFSETNWNNVSKTDAQIYLINASSSNDKSTSRNGYLYSKRR
ncbi:DNA/RNA helicase domain-containing protein [Paenibacillus sp. P3E]|uniref:DNA/RNA helicase domain-containing protein n=1 Tax=unclassified Paenibacillus TaxID=185978 RepID=UPI00353268E8